MPRPSTGISTAPSRVAMGTCHRVLGHRPVLLVHVAEIHRRSRPCRWRAGDRPNNVLQGPSCRPSGHARKTRRCTRAMSRVVRMAFRTARAPSASRRRPASSRRRTMEACSVTRLLRLPDVAVGQGDNILWLVHGAHGWPEPRPNAGTAANDRAPWTKTRLCSPDIRRAVSTSPHFFVPLRSHGPARWAACAAALPRASERAAIEREMPEGRRGGDCPRDEVGTAVAWTRVS